MIDVTITQTGEVTFDPAAPSGIYVYHTPRSDRWFRIVNRSDRRIVVVSDAFDGPVFMVPGKVIDWWRC